MKIAHLSELPGWRGFVRDAARMGIGGLEVLSATPDHGALLVQGWIRQPRGDLPTRTVFFPGKPGRPWQCETEEGFGIYDLPAERRGRRGRS